MRLEAIRTQLNPLFTILLWEWRARERVNLYSGRVFVCIGTFVCVCVCVTLHMSVYVSVCARVYVCVFTHIRE